MNLRAEDLASGVLRDRVKVGASLADVDPMNLDTSVSICHAFQTGLFNLWTQQSISTDQTEHSLKRLQQSS